MNIPLWKAVVLTDSLYTLFEIATFFVTLPARCPNERR